MLILLSAVFSTLCSMFRSRAALELEHIALRHQIGVLKRSARKRPKLTAADRVFWVFLSRVWGKIRHGLVGRPAVPLDLRNLIRKMSRENPTWGAPRIHGELLKLGVDISETSVSKYMVRRQKPPFD